MLSGRQTTIAILSVLSISSASLLAAPASARPNDGRYEKSSEAGIKARYCKDVKRILDYQEKEADKRAGTKAAKKWADAADESWERGVENGCPWAT